MEIRTSSILPTPSRFLLWKLRLLISRIIMSLIMRGEGGDTDAITPFAGWLILAAGTVGAPEIPTPNRIDPNLELRLQPGELVHGIAVGFSFEIVNVGKHAIRVPKPIVDCGGE